MNAEAVTPDPTALRALSHPVRLRMLGLLRSEGPSTASRLAQRLSLNSGATSYHLRNLAQHGFVIDAPERGNGRDRWWRAAHQMTNTADRRAASSPEARDAIDAFAQAVAVVHSEQLQRAVEERPLLPRHWWSASVMSDWGIRLRREDAAELRDRIDSLMTSFMEREVGKDADDSTVMVYQVHAFPRPGTTGPVEP